MAPVLRPGQNFFPRTFGASGFGPLGFAPGLSCMNAVQATRLAGAAAPHLALAGVGNRGQARNFYSFGVVFTGLRPSSITERKTEFEPDKQCALCVTIPKPTHREGVDKFLSCPVSFWGRGAHGICLCMLPI